MADIQEKYQKLAGEYAKLKAQIPVLKKAYLDEQDDGNNLKQMLKEKDQSMRKYEQEVDSLSFRNQQLSKRVIFLQEELDDTKTPNKKKTKPKKSEPSTPDFDASVNGRGNVFNEELHNKIEENAVLHRQLQEVSSEFEIQIRQLQKQIEASESSKGKHESVFTVARKKAQEQIDKLQEEKAMLEVKLQTLETDIKEYRGRSEHAEHNLQSVEKNLQERLDKAVKIIDDKLPFIDTEHASLNALNLPTHNRRHQLRAKELITQGANLIGELMQGFSNFFTYSEQRSKIYPADGVTEPLSPMNILFCKYLHENLVYLRPVEQSLRQFVASLNDDSITTIETASELQQFSLCIKRMVAYMNKLMPYYVASLEEENAVSSCTATLSSKNKDLVSSLKRMNAVFNKMDTYVALLAAQSTQDQSHPQSAHGKFFSLLCVTLSHLHDGVRTVSKHYNSKVSLEHQLPTASKELKRTDECVVASLISLVTNTGKMAAFMSGNLDFFTQSAGYRTRGGSLKSDASSQTGQRAHPCVNDFRLQAAKYLATITKPATDSVPHCIAVGNRTTVLSSTESKEGLAKQISVLQQKVTKLEQEKEHYLLEVQLLKIKFENEQVKCQQVEKELDGLRSSSGISSASASLSLDDHIEKLAVPSESSTRSDSVNSGSYIDTSMLGEVKVAPQANPVTRDLDTREELITSHFTKRTNELTLHLQQAESKAVSFHAEVRALQKQLKIAEKSKGVGQDELRIAHQSLAQLKDELQTTSRSYEGQLSMMSEHLAGMNEKLAQQKDEIDELKQQQQSAKSSSGKMSLGKKLRK